MERLLRPGSRSRRLLIAAAIYLLIEAVFFSVIPRQRILEHTAFNHFALLADGWLEGRLDLGQPPPGYAQNNDFASFDGRWFVAFPPFPAVLLVPLVWLAGGPEHVRDGQFFTWLAGVGPAIFFVALEKLRRAGRSERTERENAFLSLLFAFGTVYFFTAVQGTVWFAAHVVAVAIAALYVLCAIDAERPVMAGLMVGLGFMTRTPLLLMVPLFAYEAVRASLGPRREAATPVGQPARSAAPANEPEAAEANEPVSPPAGRRPQTRPDIQEKPPTRRARLALFWADLDKRALLWRYVLFALPIIACLGVSLWHNAARFGSALDFGYQYLTVAWQGRMKKWGLFDYHFLARNLGVILTSLPWLEKDGPVPFRVNAHGLALWVTTPLYLWLLWPKRVRGLEVALYVTAGLVALPTLLYQNTGWIQFGYRFSNDYALFLFVLLATTGRRFGTLFHLAALWSIAVNAFGAATFDRPQFRQYYYEDRAQKIIYQPD